MVMPDPDIDDPDLDDRILDAPYRGPVVMPSADPRDLDPVPEPLRPTPFRLTLWTAVVLGMFVIIAALFFFGQFMPTSNPTAATNPPAKQIQSTDSG
jgi:hypothetical protein